MTLLREARQSQLESDSGGEFYDADAAGCNAKYFCVQASSTLEQYLKVLVFDKFPYDDISYVN